jgi:hypothetical protein
VKWLGIDEMITVKLCMSFWTDGVKDILFF